MTTLDHTVKNIGALAAEIAGLHKQAIAITELMTYQNIIIMV
jgi:hypothetical protein